MIMEPLWRVEDHLTGAWIWIGHYSGTLHKVLGICQRIAAECAEDVIDYRVKPALPKVKND